MTAKGQIKQRTITLDDGQKVVIKSRQRDYGGGGFVVWINDQRFNAFSKITHQDAQDSAYVRWVNQQGV